MVITTQEFNNMFSTKSVITQFIKEWLHWNKRKQSTNPIRSSFLKIILRKLVIKLLFFWRRIFVARHKLPNHAGVFLLSPPPNVIRLWRIQQKWKVIETNHFIRFRKITFVLLKRPTLITFKIFYIGYLKYVQFIYLFQMRCFFQSIK